MKKIFFIFIASLLVTNVDAQPAAPAAAGKAGGKAGGGASRDWTIDARSFVNLLLTNSYKPDNGTATDQSGQAFDIEFGRNMGRIEFGPRFGYFNASETTASTRGTTVGGYFRFNFIPNRAGDTLVPYAKLYLLTSNQDTAGASFDITTVHSSIGATWFPVNDSLGISGFLAYRDSKLTGGKISGFSLSGTINVYF